MRNTLSAAIVLALGLSIPLGTALAEDVPATQSSAPAIDFDLPAQSLADSLRTVATESRTSVLFDTGALEGRLATPLKARLTVDEAIGRLLSGSGLTYRRINETTIVLAPQPSSSPVVMKDERASASSAGRIRWAQADLQDSEDRGSGLARTQGKENGDSPSLSGAAGAGLEEIVVTAQKRQERLIDVPVPVTVMNAQKLAESNQLRLQDYFTSIPAVNLRPSIQSNQTVSIRGITTGTGNPTVGMLIDDVPFGSSTGIGGGQSVPDVDPADLARIEVLRGPQGTLYGASSMGGLIKFVTREPSPDAFDGQIHAGVTGVRGSDDYGYSLRGSLNIPLADTVALRASAFTRRDAGYVDNVQSAQSDVNRIDASGGRVSLLWRPSDDFSLKLNALVQQTQSDGSPSVDALLGDLKQSRLQGTGWYERTVQAYSAIAGIDFGSVSLTSITGYNIYSYDDSFDAGFVLGASAQSTYGVSAAALITNNETEKFTQEIRLTAPVGQRLELRLGAFYANEDSFLSDRRLAVDPASGAVAGQLDLFRWPTTYEEHALFADLTVNVTDRFDVQFGARHSEISPSFTQIRINAAGLVTVVPESTADSSPFTYLVTPRFRVTPDVMVYARFASGFRTGRSNINPGGVVPAQYEPDTTRNYEIGAKADLFDHVLSLDASVYRIDWDDIQINLRSPSNLSYTSNAGTARSQGAEISWNVRPWSGTTITGWVAWNDAELIEDFPASSAAVGISGARLPYSARLSGNLAVEQEFPLWNAVDGYVGGAVSYLGDRKGPFVARTVPARHTFPSFAQIDLRAGLRNGGWTIALFVNNVGDERGQLFGGAGETTPANAFTYTQPRTFGMSLSRSF